MKVKKKNLFMVSVIIFSVFLISIVSNYNSLESTKNACVENNKTPNIEQDLLAFGSANVQIDSFWFEVYKLSGNISNIEQQRTLIFLQSILKMKPPNGRIKVIIAHSFPNGIGLGQISNMGTVIVKPKGQGKGYEIVSRLSLAELNDLLR